MAVGTPFHERHTALCRSHAWRQWSGYLTVASYDDFVQPEYAAIRNAAALIDVSPLYKVWVTGPDADALLDHVVTRDVRGLEPGRVAYTPWCDPDGHVRQEGTVFRMESDAFAVCAAEPVYGWIRSNAVGFDATVTERSRDFAALSLQGPHSREILAELCGDHLRELGFFRMTGARVGRAAITVSRTGYTGDLGYELWIPRGHALAVWDALLEAGQRWQLTPCGLVAMDIARIEAGFILIGVDYTSSEVARIPSDRVTPYELGLDWTVALDKGNFVGREALLAERSRGSRRRVVGLEIGWQPLEKAFIEAGLMPELPMTVCRESVPVYSAEGLQTGRASSRVWSKLLKKYIAIATVEAAEASPGNRLQMEVTVDYRRRRIPATVVSLPFFRPERLRAAPIRSTQEPALDSGP